MSLPASNSVPRPRVSLRLLLTLTVCLYRAKSSDRWRERLYKATQSLDTTGAAHRVWAWLGWLPLIGDHMESWIHLHRGTALLSHGDTQEGLSYLRLATSSSDAGEARTDWLALAAAHCYKYGAVTDGDHFAATLLHDPKATDALRVRVHQARLGSLGQRLDALPKDDSGKSPLLQAIVQEVECILTTTGSAPADRQAAVRVLAYAQLRTDGPALAWKQFARLHRLGSSETCDLERFQYCVFAAITSSDQWADAALEYADLRLHVGGALIDIVSWIDAVSQGFARSQRKECAGLCRRVHDGIYKLEEHGEIGRWSFFLTCMEIKANRCRPVSVLTPSAAVAKVRACISPEAIPIEIIRLCDSALLDPIWGGPESPDAVFESAANLARTTFRGSQSILLWITTYAHEHGSSRVAVTLTREVDRLTSLQTLKAAAPACLPSASLDLIERIASPTTPVVGAKEILEDAHDIAVERVIGEDRIDVSVFIASVAMSLGFASQAEFCLMSAHNSVRSYPDPVVRAKLTLRLCVQMVERGMVERFKMFFESAARDGKTVAFQSHYGTAGGFSDRERIELEVSQRQLEHLLATHCHPS